MITATELGYSRFACPNPQCSVFGQRNGGNIDLYFRYGKKQVRLLVCATCGKTFSELKGTPFWDSRLDWVEIRKVYSTLLAGRGIRATATINGMSKNTVKRYLRLACREPQVVVDLINAAGQAKPIQLAAIESLHAHILRDTCQVL